MMFTCATPGCSDPGHDHPSASPQRRRAVAAAKRGATSTRVIRSRRGKHLRIDIHCHYLNQTVAAKVAPLNPAQHEPSVEFANALTRYYWTEPDLGAELSRMVNDRLAEIVATWPDRFVALGTVPLQNVDLAIAELERGVKQLGLRGVEINPNVNGMELTDPRLNLEKFFARAQALDAVIFMHPIGFTQGERLVDHYFNNVIGNPMETTIAASHLIFDGVMQRNPKLKIVLPHAGGYLAHYWARMDHAHRARADCRTMIKKAPSSYLKKMYFDTISFDPQMLRHMVDQYGPGHLLLGTDYPYDMGEENPVGLIGCVPRLKRAERDMIEGVNAARLLKIKR